MIERLQDRMKETKTKIAEISEKEEPIQVEIEKLQTESSKIADEVIPPYHPIPYSIIPPY